jgi:hypothetical protein
LKISGFSEERWIMPTIIHNYQVGARTIIAAAMHKLVRIAYRVLKNQRPYDPSYATAA